MKDFHENSIRSDKQLLHRRLIFNDCLPKFNTENLKFVLSQFVSNGTNGPTKGEFFSYYYPAGAKSRKPLTT